MILLSASALLLAGCAAPASSAASTPSASVPVAAPSVSAAAIDNASSPTAKASAVAPSPSDTVSAEPKLSTADTCKAFAAVLKANNPAVGSSDNQKYWATVRDQLRPVVEKASAEAKPSLDGVFAYFDTRANHWEPTPSKAVGQQATQAFDSFDKVCSKK